MRTLITNGTIVTADGSYAADVLIDGETIAQLGRDLAAAGVDRRRDHRRDRASTSSRAGSTSTPTWSCRSAGRSPRTPSRPGPARRRSAGRPRSSTSRSSRAGQSLREGLDTWHAKAEGNAVTDYGFHMIMSDVNDDTLAEMDGLVAEGVPGLQAVHRLPGRLLQRRRGDLPGDAADRNERRADHDARRERDGHRRRRGADRRGRHDRSDRPRPRPQGDLRGRGDQPGHPPGRGGRRPRLHRPPVGARGARRGASRPRATAAPRCSPRPARSTCSSPSTTWATGSTAPSSCARRRSAPRTTGTTCGPASSRTTCSSSRPTIARSTSTARRSWGGAISARCPTACRASRIGIDLLHDGGVLAGKISRERWVEIISTAPAKLFGMYPQKGAVAVGSDADLVVYDPERGANDLGASHHMNVDYSCYEGRVVQGASDVVLSRGSVVVRDGEFTGRKGAGRFIKRSPADYARRPCDHGRAGRRRGDGPRRRAGDRARGERGHDLSDRLWSARLLLTDPAAIEDVHLAYFRAGAEVATTASYQASIEGFAAAGLDRAAALRAHRVERRARAASARPLSRRIRATTGRSSSRARSDRTGRCSPTARSIAATTTRAPAALDRLPSAADRGAGRGRRRPPRVRDDPDGARGRGPRRAARRGLDPGLAELLVPGRAIHVRRRTDRRRRSPSGNTRGSWRSASTARHRATCRHCSPRRGPRPTGRSSPTRTAAIGGTRRAGAGWPTTAAATTRRPSRRGPHSARRGSAAAAGPGRPRSPRSPSWFGGLNANADAPACAPRSCPRPGSDGVGSCGARRSGSRPG